ncbi:unnamed protein product, partial [Ascophyllum nodosum]
NINSLERPPYKVSKTICVGGIKAELREYEPYLIAESEVTGDTMKAATSKGFRNVAGYIFGDNYGGRVSEDGTVEPQKVAMTAPVRTEQSQKVAMTSPVRTQLWGNDGNMKVSFVMPRKYTPETLPKPKSKGVKIRRVGAHRLVAISFSGRSPDEDKIVRVSRDLFQALESEGLTPKGRLMVYQYHPPFMPGFLRRNEVAVQV